VSEATKLRNRARTIFGGRTMADDRDQVERFLDQVRTITEEVAALVIAGQLHQGDDFVEAVDELLDCRGARVREGIQALAARLPEGLDLDVPDPAEDDADQQSPLADAVISVGVEYGRAGYLLGLAVGMRLGPEALTGGAR